MSTIFSTTSSALMTAVTEVTGLTLPILSANDDGDGIDLSDGFLMVDIQYRRNDQVTINGSRPKVRLRGSIHIAICTPANQGVSTSLGIADKLHSHFSRQRFSGVFCYPAYIDTPYKLAYSKGNYWNTPFLCNFYIEDYLNAN